MSTPTLDELLRSPPPVPSELRARYPATCPCGHDFELAPSLAMRMGHNSGHVTCSKCGAFLHVELADDQARVESWDAYLARSATPAPGGE